MFDIKGSIHDRYTLEFKIGYSRDNKEQEESDFRMDTWMFIPDTLGVNQSTYTKERFYRDFRTMVRLITPSFTLSEIANTKKLPYSRLEKWCLIASRDVTSGLAKDKRQTKRFKRHNHMFQHQVKMFGAIYRSAIRNEALQIMQIEDADECEEAVRNLAHLSTIIATAYHELPSNTNLDIVSEELKTCFALGDEYLCRNTVTTCFRLMEHIHSRFDTSRHANMTAPLMECIARDKEYELSKGHILPEEGDNKHNREFLHRAGQLKKYIESDLWIGIHPRSNTFLLQQFVFMIAAGVSMVFATVVSFSFQQTYGNFTTPLFIALVISYMFKDRTKELLRIWFATKLGSYMYEYKTKLGYSDEEIGYSKTGMDFVHFHKLPKEILEQRGPLSTLETGNATTKEKVIIFRQRLFLFSRKLQRLSHYPLQGVNQLLRINLREFLRRMDASHAPLYLLDTDSEGGYHTIPAEKVYYVHFVMRIRYQGTTEYRRFRVCLHRRGAISIDEYTL